MIPARPYSPVSDLASIFRGCSNPFASDQKLIEHSPLRPLPTEMQFRATSKRKHDQASLFRRILFLSSACRSQGIERGSTAGEPRFRDIPCWASRASTPRFASSSLGRLKKEERRKEESVWALQSRGNPGNPGQSRAIPGNTGQSNRRRLQTPASSTASTMASNARRRAIQATTQRPTGDLVHPGCSRTVAVCITLHKDTGRSEA